MEIYDAIKKRWDSIAKPIDGLGDFEDVICKIGSIQKTEKPAVACKALAVMCADNGIVEEGVSQCGAEVTYQVACALGSGTSTACIMAKEAGIRCIPVDIGIDHDGAISGVLSKKIRKGTRNFLKERALTEDEVCRAIEEGKNIVASLKAEGVDIVATGEMGIGNTTTATVLLCLLTGADPIAVTGRGAGLSDERLEIKRDVITRAVKLYAATEKESEIKPEIAVETKSVTKAETELETITDKTAFKYLCDIGGLDIAAMCGMFLGGREYGVPIVIDGLISGVAALIAERLSPGCKDFMIPSHLGRESGLKLVLDELGLKAFINGNMALGEGTGAILMLKLLDSAIYLYDHGAIFEDNGIKEYERFQ